MKALRANRKLCDRLEVLKRGDRHLGQTGKGLMIDDPATVAMIARVASKLGISKREAVRQSLARELEAQDA